MMSGVVWQRRALKLRAKVDTYQGNARLKTHVRPEPHALNTGAIHSHHGSHPRLTAQVITASPIDYKLEGKLLLGEIAKYQLPPPTMLAPTSLR